MPVDRYAVNDALTALMTRFGVRLDDETLNELTHHVAEVLRPLAQRGGSMNLEMLLEATEEERQTIARVMTRIVDRPAIVVTVDLGTKRRRHVVAIEDEPVFDGLSGSLSEEFRTDHLSGMRGMVSFGCQRLRRMGVVDEMYRSLSLYEVTKVEWIDRARVWAADPNLTWPTDRSGVRRDARPIARRALLG